MELQFCFIANCTKGNHVQKHTHPALELVYYTKGRGRTAIGKRDYAVQEHSLAVIPANVPHDQTNLTDMTSICVAIAHSRIESLQGTWIDTTGVMGRLFKILLEEIKGKKTGFDHIAEGLLLEIQGHILRLVHDSETPPQKEDLVHKAIDVIHRHDGDISVSDIAKRLYVSKDYLRHLFHEYAGESPMKYLLRARIEKARSLLSNKNLRIGEIAEQCGFEDIYYFSRLFRKVTGRTPSSFRKESIRGGLGTKNP